MKLPEPPLLRPLNRDDVSERNLVLSGWLNTYVGSRRGGPSSEEIPKGVTPGVEPSVFYRLYRPVVHDLLDRCEVTCAVMHDAPDVIYGWMATEGDVLHYIATKTKWQRLGIATFLLGAFEGATYTHRTKDSERHPAFAKWRYAPMLRFKEVAA